jgi:hypothetical protein
MGRGARKSLAHSTSRMPASAAAPRSLCRRNQKLPRPLLPPTSAPPPRASLPPSSSQPLGALSPPSPGQAANSPRSPVLRSGQRQPSYWKATRATAEAGAVNRWHHGHRHRVLPVSPRRGQIRPANDLNPLKLVRVLPMPVDERPRAGVVRQRLWDGENNMSKNTVANKPLYT